MTIININKNKRHGIFERLFYNLSCFGLLSFAFWFNHKFIGGNNFLDFIYFFILVCCGIDLAQKQEIYPNIDDDKIKKIREILE